MVDAPPGEALAEPAPANVRDVDAAALAVFGRPPSEPPFAPGASPAASLSGGGTVSGSGRGRDGTGAPAACAGPPPAARVLSGFLKKLPTEQ
eukprot:5814973-Pyramimonas_sp.AAC.1